MAQEPCRPTQGRLDFAVPFADGGSTALPRESAIPEEAAMADGDERLPAAVWSGTFTLFGVTLHCHVLETGERLIEAGDVEALFRAMAEPATELEPDPDDIQRLGRWMNGIDE